MPYKCLKSFVSKLAIWILPIVGILLSVPVWAQAPTYPHKPIRLIVPGGPGGGVDTISRLIAPPLGASLGQIIVADNRPGAGTVLASELTARASPDGYTLLAVTISHAINAGIQAHLRYQPIADFAPITLIATVPNLLVAHPVAPFKSVKDIVSLGSAQSQKYFYASAGNGSGTHLAFELFQFMAKTKMIHVPHRSGSAALVDLVGGNVQLMFSNTINASPFVKSKRLNALAVSSLRRTSLFPDLPTISESGLLGYSSDAWYGLLAPANTPQSIVNRINLELLKILKTKEINERIVTQGAEVVGGGPTEFKKWMSNEVEKWVKLSSTVKIKID
jgi:tripartite-type tricarboxylate transporter receptor subunit TctC